MVGRIGPIISWLAVMAGGFALAYEEIPVNGGGVISGVVTIESAVPKVQPVQVVKNPEFCGQSVLDPVLVVNPDNGGVKNTIVYLEEIDRGKSLPLGTAIDLFDCLFVPHATAIVKNRKVMFHNNDMVLHNVHAFDESGATLFNIALPNMRQVVQKRVKNEGLIRIQCDSHAHMNAWVISLDHPYFSVTDERGRYRITDVPPGHYRLVMWHEGYTMMNQLAYEESLRTDPGFLQRPVYDKPYRLTQSVEVKAMEETHVDFVLQRR